jgi:EAL domain-containing protein (putative c-di-GMP-specific phosphodiesterase class I)
VEIMNSKVDGARLADDLRRAMERGELAAHYQPQYELLSGRLVGLEALCRWGHPDLGAVPPDHFIPVAERFDLIGRLGRYMLELSAGQVTSWRDRGVSVMLAVNVSPSELESSFVNGVLGHLSQVGLPPEAVTLEVTESPALRESDEEYRVLELLIAAGNGVSIDDFGAGFTSLEGLRRLPYTEVKIDRSLMDDWSAATDQLVNQAVGIAHGRGARVVAEGIENSRHLDRARAWGCDRGQGYFLAPPLDEARIEPFLAQLTH